MANTKRDEVREFIKRETTNAISVLIATIADKEAGSVIRSNRENIAITVSWHIAEQYRFLELCDIMEWKRTRARR